MTYVTTDYRIAANHNNAAGLTLITALSVGGVLFVEPQGLRFVNRGRRVIRANGAVARVGLQRTEWESDMLFSQYQHLVTTYEGLVTVRTALDGATWVNYNAILSLPDPSEMEYVVFAAGSHDNGFEGPGFRNVRWTFTRLDAI